MRLRSTSGQGPARVGLDPLNSCSFGRPYEVLLMGTDCIDTDDFCVSAVLRSGIPHAVLIDRLGNVRMIKVGSGPANSKALHEMIEVLLAE